MRDIKENLTGCPTIIGADNSVDEDKLLEYFQNKSPELTELPAKWRYFATSYSIQDWRERTTGEGGAGNWAEWVAPVG
jgi:hypothetical protein